MVTKKKTQEKLITVQNNFPIGSISAKKLTGQIVMAVAHIENSEQYTSTYPLVLKPFQFF